jgi:hypothetical protein
VAHDAHGGGGGQGDEVVLKAAEGFLEPGAFLREEAGLLVDDDSACGAAHLFGVAIEHVGDEPGGFLSGEVGPFAFPLEAVAPQHEGVAVLGERLGDAGPHRGTLPVGSVEGDADMAGAVGDANGCPWEAACLEVDASEQVPGEIGGVIEVPDVLGKRRLDRRLTKQLSA